MTAHFARRLRPRRNSVQDDRLFFQTDTPPKFSTRGSFHALPLRRHSVRRFGWVKSPADSARKPFRAFRAFRGLNRSASVWRGPALEAWRAERRHPPALRKYFHRLQGLISGSSTSSNPAAKPSSGSAKASSASPAPPPLAGPSPGRDFSAQVPRPPSRYRVPNVPQLAPAG